MHESKKIIIFITFFFLSLIWFGIFPGKADAETNWPMFKQNLSHTGYTLSNAPNNNNLLWKTFINTSKISNAAQSSPVIKDGIIYVGQALSGATDPTGVIAIDAASGKIIWDYIVGGANASVVSTPAIAYDRVYFGSGNFSVYSLDKTSGQLIWKYPTGGLVLSSPSVYDGKVYIASFDGYLYALNATTTNPNGELIWKTAIGKIPHSSPAIADNMACIGSGGPGSTPANLTCLNASTGQKIWEFISPGGIYASPVIANGILYFNSDSGYIYALNSATGTLLWSYKIGPNGTSPSVAFDRVFTMNDMSIEGTTYGERYVYSFDALSGALLWKYNVTKVSPIDGQSNNPKSSPAISADGKLLIGIDGKGLYWPAGQYQKGAIISLNAKTSNPNGELIWKYELGEGVIVDSSPAIADGIVYVSPSDGYLYAFGQGPDIFPPVISNGSPSGILPAGTAQTTMSVTTNENATCRWSSTAGTSYSSMSNTFSTTGDMSHSTTITGLNNNQAYLYYIRCQDANGNFNVSDYTIAFMVALPDTIPPSPPGTPTATNVTYSSLTLSWTASTDNMSVAGYRIERCQGSGCTNFTQIGTTGTNSYNDNSLSVNTLYRYRVRAIDGAGNLSTYSGIRDVTTAAPPSFGIGVRVKTTAKVNVRSKPTTGSSGKILCLQSAGSLGTITKGPQYKDSYTWWYINFDISCDGWVVQNYINTQLAVAPSTTMLAAAMKFNRQMDIGTIGNDVTILQIFLASNDQVYPEKLVTGYFGQLTANAVSAFQKLYGLPAAGRVGPLTLQKLNDLLGL